MYAAAHRASEPAAVGLRFSLRLDRIASRGLGAWCPAHKNLGLSLEGQGRLAEAIKAYLQACDRAPGDIRALNRLEAMVAEHPELLESRPGLADLIHHHRQTYEAARAKLS